MIAARITQAGKPPSFETLPLPVVGLHDVLVRVNCVCLDAMSLAAPAQIPHTIGTDLAGTVVKAGSLSARWQAGDRVVAQLDASKGGALAEFAVVRSHQLSILPPTVGMSQAVCLLTAGMLAWRSLFATAGLSGGQSVFINSTRHQVGRIAVQLARLAGARVVTTAPSLGHDHAQALGADIVLDESTDGFVDRLRDMDVVFDVLGGSALQDAFRTLRTGGVLVSLSTLPSAALARAHGIRVAHATRVPEPAAVADLIGLIAAGRLRIAEMVRVQFAELHLPLLADALTSDQLLVLVEDAGS